MDSKVKCPKCQNDSFNIVEDKVNDNGELSFKVVCSNPSCDFELPLESYESFKQIS